ncbi:hypothetical protein PPYR_12217 [Photinus pyralis]|uniref:YEATS domain-containing protein 4 n=1 Tax=Photinus pyralis TaxID=7054 RepID=A0A1Y1LRD1_PHOPY|nr:YEATS domain-containing protein 4 isoform X2 [Photinus pyralis]XP_031351233.1 YEATS domain-containing protein 4 isoform X2 [Photinus pyralis]KAB0795378.1 hypothetical protein PPYR_12217 [Photinus pyralis]
MSLPTDFGPDSGGRIKGVCIVKPIVYGNVARYFGKKREEDGHTHQWTVYVKPYYNEDMSAFIKKVHFKLHESYTNQNRIVVKPPYEISETGWGEFEIVIKIHFHDPNERPVTMYHILKLFHSGNTNDIGLEQGKGLVSESYDEIVFQDPTQLMHHLLTNTKQLTLSAWDHNTNFEEKKKKTVKTIQDAKHKVRLEVVLLKNRLKLARETIAQFKEEIAKLQENQYVI